MPFKTTDGTDPGILYGWLGFLLAACSRKACPGCRCGPDRRWITPLAVAAVRPQPTWPSRCAWDGRGRVVACGTASAYPAGPASGSWRDPDAAGVLPRRRPRQALVAVAPRRPASVRSSKMAAAAATRAAPMAIRAICQPAMPPVLITRTVAGASGVTEVVQDPPGGGIGRAKAAGLSATRASKPQVTAARAAASRPRRAPACAAAVS